MVAGAVVALQWLISSDEPAAPEYVKLKDRRAYALTFSRDGTKLFVDTDDADHPRWTWDLGARPWKDVDGRPGEAPEKGQLTAVALSPDGKRFATGTQSTSRERKAWIFTWDYVYTNGVVRVRKQDTGETVWQTDVRELPLFDAAYYGNVTSVAFSPDGSLLAGSYGNSTTLVWDAATGAVRATLKGADGQFSLDGSLLAVVDYHEVHLWDTAKRQVKTTLTAPPPSRVLDDPLSFRSLEFSPDGRRLATSLSDGTVRLWDVATGAVRATMTDRSGSVDALVFSPDGRLLATRAGDGIVRLWDTATGAVKATLPRPAGSVLVFSPDGRRLATGSEDGEVLVWDSTSWQETRALEHRERFLLWTTGMAISHMAFSPDGTKLAVASNRKQDGRVALWELP
jgi:WD40 repeat protein